VEAVKIVGSIPKRSAFSLFLDKISNKNRRGRGQATNQRGLLEESSAFQAKLAAFFFAIVKLTSIPKTSGSEGSL